MIFSPCPVFKQKAIKSLGQEKALREEGDNMCVTINSFPCKFNIGHMVDKFSLVVVHLWEVKG